MYLFFFLLVLIAFISVFMMTTILFIANKTKIYLILFYLVQTKHILTTSLILDSEQSDECVSDLQ